MEGISMLVILAFSLVQEGLCTEGEKPVWNHARVHFKCRTSRCEGLRHTFRELGEVKSSNITNLHKYSQGTRHNSPDGRNNIKRNLKMFTTTTEGLSQVTLLSQEISLDDHFSSENILTELENTAEISAGESEVEKDEESLKIVIERRYPSEGKLCKLLKLVEMGLPILRNVSSSQIFRLIAYINKNCWTHINFNEKLFLGLAAENNTFASKQILRYVENVYFSDTFKNTALHYAAKNGNAPLATAICERDVGGIDALNGFGESALHIAVSRNNSTVCQILLDSGANPYISNEYGLNSVHLAVQNKNSEILEYILNETSGEIDKKNREGETALWLAVKTRNSALTKILVKAGADPFISIEKGFTCLHLGAMNGDEQVVKVILSANYTGKDMRDSEGDTALSGNSTGVDKRDGEGGTALSANSTGVDMRDSEGDTALSVAVKQGSDMLTEILLKAGANPNISNNVGQTPLHLAVRRSSANIVELLLKDNRTIVDARDSSGVTPLLMAAFNGLASIAELLLINRADVNIADHHSVSPLHAASTLGSLDILQSIFNARNPMPNLQDEDGNTPLHYAVSMNQIETVSVLLENGADPKILNIECQTSLHSAAALGDTRILIPILNSSKSIEEIQDYQGRTGLHIATLHGHSLAVLTLLQHGANPNTTDHSGFNALRVALRNAIDDKYIRDRESHEGPNWIQIIQYLLRFGSDPYIRDGEGCTALHAAAKLGNTEIVTSILSHSKIGIDIQDSNLCTALNVAAFSEQTEVALVLLRNGANPYIKDGSGRTLLHLAAIYGDAILATDILTRNRTGVNLKDAAGRSALSLAVSFPATDSDEGRTFSPAGVGIKDGVYRATGNSETLTSQLRETAFSNLPKVYINENLSSINKIIQAAEIIYNFHKCFMNRYVLEYSSYNSIQAHGEIVKVCYHGKMNDTNLRTLGLKRLELVDILMKNGADYRVIYGDGNTVFHSAVSSGNLDVLEYFMSIVTFAEMNKTNNKGETLLHIAAKNGYFNITKFLLSKGIDPYRGDSNGRTALHAAVEMQDLKTMQLILNTSKEGIDFRDNSGFTALSLSTSSARRTKERCELLLQSGADPYVADNAGHTALHAAVIEAVQWVYYHNEGGSLKPIDVTTFDVSQEYYAGKLVCFINEDKYIIYRPKIDSISVVELLLKYNSSGIDMKSEHGYTALFLAAIHSSNDADTLLRLGADPYIPDHEGRTSLHAAILTCWHFPSDCNFSFIREILKLKNAGVNMTDIDGYSALHYASSTSPDLVSLLLENGADPNRKDNHNGWTSLHIAVRQQDAGFAKALLENPKTDVNAQNDEGQTPLHLAEESEIVNLLISKGGDVQRRDQRGWTGLHYSAFYGNRDVIFRTLSTNSTHINDPSLFGETLLSIATATNDFDLVEFLLDKGADSNLAYDYLKSPLEIAISANNMHIFYILSSKVENLLAYNIFGLNIIHTASWLGNLEAIQIIREILNGTMDIPDRFSHTPLQYAAIGRHDAVFNYLLRDGANPLVTDHLGHNILHYAAEGCSGVIIESILLRVKEIVSKNEVTAFINKQNFLDLTPLQLAAFNRNWEAFVLLWNESTFWNVSDYTSSQSILFPTALGGETVILEYILGRTNLSVNERTTYGITPAMAAAARGRKEAFELLISKGARVNDVTAYGHTMLHFGAQGGETSIIEYILNNSNFGVNSRDVEGFTPLMHAVYRDNLDAAELLLNYSADPLLQNVYGDDVIKIAARVGNAVLKSTLFRTSDNPDSVLGLLLARRNASFDKQVLYDWADKSSLHKYSIFIAAAKGNMAELKRILTSPFKVRNRSFPNLLKEIMNDFGDVLKDMLENDEHTSFNDARLSPLDIALLFHQNLTVVKYIIQNLKVKPTTINYKSTTWTPLDYALFTDSKLLSNSSTNVLLYLLNKCKHLLNESTNVFGWTVAHKAAWAGNYHAIRFLKYFGIDLNRADDFGRTPLHYAALNGHWLVLNAILHASNASINVKDKHGLTPLILAQMYNHRQFFRRFSKVNSDTPSEERFFVVQFSNYLSKISKIYDDSYFRTTEALIASKADLDVHDTAFGWTALHWAVVSGDYQCVQILVSHGAKVNLRSWTGETPLFIARKWMKKQIYNYLRYNNGVW